MVLEFHRDPDVPLPSDAIILNRDDALKYQTRIISQWTPASDVFPLKYGQTVLGVVAAASTIYFHNYYRYKLRLLHYGRIVTYIPTVIIPSACSIVFHNVKVLSPVVLQELKCPVCVETRSALIQCATAVCIPAILAPVSAFMMATRHLTYDVPPISSDPAAVYRLWRRFTKPKYNAFMALFGINAILGAGVVYFETKSIIKISEVSMRKEQENILK